MRTVYIAHPLGKGPDREANRASAAKWVAWAAEQGVCPMATWITLSGEWDESDEHRRRGLEMDYAQINRCDEMWLCGSHISPGMGLEAEHAKRISVPVLDMRKSPGSPGNPS